MMPKHPGPPWQAKLIMDLSIEYGVPVNAVEFTNEPNLMSTSGFPKGYTAAHFRRDQEIANAWVKENYPGVLLVGPAPPTPPLSKWVPAPRVVPVSVMPCPMP